MNTLMRRNANSVGFAVPINRFRSVVADLEAGTPVRWSFLGVSHRTLTPAEARRAAEVAPPYLSQPAEILLVLVKSLKTPTPSCRRTCPL